MFLASLRRRIGAFIGGFEAALGNRRLRHVVATRAHINSLIAASGRDMLARARYLVRNNGYATNAVEGFAGNAIGAGITPSFQVRNKALRKRIADAWEGWVDAADFEGQTDFYGLQRRAAREMFIAGEVFFRFHIVPAEDGSVPLKMQLLPSEMLPLNKTALIGGEGSIRQGIEFDGAGKRVAYHFYRRHPADSTEPRPSAETVRVPASEVIHLFDPVDAGQIRGVTPFTAAIVKMFTLDFYDDAELDRKKTAAMHALFVTTPKNETPFGPENTNAANGERQIDLQPGSVVILDPGENVTVSNPAESGATYEPFQYRTLLQISAALGIPYTILTNDMMKANYSNSRSAMVEFRRRVEAFQHAVIVFQLCRAVIGRFLEVGDLSRAIVLPGFASRRREFQRTSWLPPRWEWVDPAKDTRAEVEQIDAGLKSRKQAVAERGYDVERLDEEIAEDRAREQRLGLDFRSQKRGKDEAPEEPENQPVRQP